MSKRSFVILSLSALLFLNGCAPLLVAGGAAAGYGVAKDLEDGRLIDK
jgi:hypothetical protein